ncbi:hypothetical protein [Salinimicrobium sp. TH3]|uniref:hypothetical protein n=1 Tax=Salinimicrobium sp. TH3 TaxID=2997342 RepID=UPI0022731E7D|nr:hypothetical protein [Salinimicrobium sp. TH3]MCY2687589.1 hypothetical protein [Salinimicrobium sp. TH3]
MNPEDNPSGLYPIENFCLSQSNNYFDRDIMDVDSSNYKDKGVFLNTIVGKPIYLKGKRPYKILNGNSPFVISLK